MIGPTRLGVVLLACGVISCGSPRATTEGGQTIEGGGQATWVRVTAGGQFSVRFANPAWTFSGDVGARATNLEETAGTDAIGAYHEFGFAFSDGTRHVAAIRAYDGAPVALFTVTYPDGAENPAASFPTFSRYPKLPYHATYSDDGPFAPVSFSELAPDSPFVFYDDQAEAFVLSAASHFMNAATTRAPGGAISSGIDAAVTALPAGFSQQTVLVAEPGIHEAYETWGNALLSLSGKVRPANDATIELERFGYWTDHGAYYYFRYDDSLGGYPATLLAVRDYFAELGLSLGYVQLDAWWYEKGPEHSWRDNEGLYLYRADPMLFPDGLAAFQKSLGLPLITHANWLTQSSPYRSEYKISHNVAIDPAYWKMVADYIAASGVAVYEQDFLNQVALPLTDNLTDQDAFLDDMAAAMSAKGIGIQYCMPLPRHFLQSTKYPDVRTSRVGHDRFNKTRYEDFFYVSLLAHSVGVWPWSDVFFSTETDNLLLSTLSAGMFGVGDEIGTSHAGNLRRTLRPDGVIVKPDVPASPLDQTFIDQARGLDAPMVAATYTDFGGVRASYVYAFVNRGKNHVATFSPQALGYAGPVYVYDDFQTRGRLVDPAATYAEELVGGSAYWIVAPVGRSGIALVGDEGKWVSLGKKRFSSVVDDGTLKATLIFAKGEGPVTLFGYAPKAPAVRASRGKVETVAYDESRKTFRVEVTAEGGEAVVTLR